MLASKGGAISALLAVTSLVDAATTVNVATSIVTVPAICTPRSHVVFTVTPTVTISPPGSPSNPLGTCDTDMSIQCDGNLYGGCYGPGVLFVYVHETDSSSASATGTGTASSVAAPQPTDDNVICPDKNETIYTMQCGSTYKIQCSLIENTRDLFDQPMLVDSFTGCITACDAHLACVAVSYEDQVGKGLCFLKGTEGWTNTGAYAWSARKRTYGGVQCQQTRASSVINTACRPSPSPERGLAANRLMMIDYQVWIQPCSTVTWYHNFDARPFYEFSETQLQFVPMLFGNTSINFTSDVLDLVNRGYNISHVLSFNEPEEIYILGGSFLEPAAAATLWKRNIQPLAAYGIKLGAPATLYNVSWLVDFIQLCTGCTIDFIPYHWHGPTYSRVDFYTRHYQMKEAFPGATFWITSWADYFDTLVETQRNYQNIVDFIEAQPDIQRHLYFGGYRSSEAQASVNCSMLDECGRLTDIGAWYLNKSETGHIPHVKYCYDEL